MVGMASNEAFVGIGKGHVIKSRSVVRVVASQRWSKDTISKMVGIPGRLTPPEVDDVMPKLGSEYLPDVDGKLPSHISVLSHKLSS